MTELTGLAVLIVEDETIIAMSAEDMVEDMGGRVRATAHTLESALAAIAAGGFDVALLDINLHGQRSMPAAAALKAAGVPFLFTTGYGSDGPDPDHADVPVLAKPYRADEVGAAIRAAVSR